MKKQRMKTPGEYWQARCVAAESLLVALETLLSAGAAHPIMSDKINDYFDAVRRGQFAASSPTPTERK